MVKLLRKNTNSTYSTNSFIEEIFEAVKPCIEVNLQKNNEICLIVQEIRQFQLDNSNSGCYLPIEEKDLNEIYDLFIRPYLECEIYEIGTIMDVIRLNNIIDEQIAIAENDRIKLILKILRDITTVIINARNDKITINQKNNQISLLDAKYKECNIEVIKLRNRIEFLVTGQKFRGNVLEGSISMKLKKFKPMIYFQARIDIDQAWYAYLYPGCLMDPKKFQSTIAYVRSFGTLQNAYSTLIKLLDEQFKTYDDDLDDSKKIVAAEDEENETIEENENP